MDKPRIRPLTSNGDADYWLVTIRDGRKKHSRKAMLSNHEALIAHSRGEYWKAAWGRVCLAIKELRRDIACLT